MKKAILAFGLMTVALMFVSACGDSSTTSFTAASGTVTQEAATNAKSTIENATKVSFGVPTGIPSVRDEEESPFEACTTKTPSDAAVTDADNDHIKTQTRVYACTGVSAHGGTTDQSGTASVTDADDNDANSGYEFNYDVSGKSVYARAQTTTYSYKGFWKLDKNASTGAFTYSSDYKYTNTEVVTRASTPGTYSYVGGGTWSYSVTPTSAATPQDAGSLEMSGFYAGNYTPTGETQPVNYVFKFSSSGLKWDKNACTKYYKEGTVTYEDGAGNKVVYTYDCNTSTVTYNGTTI